MLGLMKNVQCCCCTALYMCHGFYHSNIIDFRHVFYTCFFIPCSMVCYIAAVLNSSPRAPPPRSAYFICYSYRIRCLFYLNVSALRSGHHRIFRHDSSSKRTYIFHSKCIEVCKTWIKIVYIYRGIWCHTRPCVKTLRTANPWMNVPK